MSVSVLKKPYKNTVPKNWFVLESTDKKAYSDPNMKSPDGDAYLISKECLSLSSLVTIASDDARSNPLPLPQEIQGKILSIILVYLNNHKGILPQEIEKPLQKDLQHVMSAEDYSYVTTYLMKDNVILMDVLEHAQSLGIKSLVDLCSAVLANMIKNKSVEEIRECLNIENDFTPTEEKKILEDNRWMMD